MQLELRVAANSKKMLMVNIVQEAASKFVIRCVPKISRSFLRAASKDKPDEWVITTEVMSHCLVGWFGSSSIPSLGSELPRHLAICWSDQRQSHRHKRSCHSATHLRSAFTLFHTHTHLLFLSTQALKPCVPRWSKKSKMSLLRTELQWTDATWIWSATTWPTRASAGPSIAWAWTAAPPLCWRWALRPPCSSCRTLACAFLPLRIIIVVVVVLVYGHQWCVCESR